MNSKKNLRKLLVALFFIAIVSSPATINAQPQSDITITTSVSACLLDIVARPEQRIPAISNWDSIVDFTILTSTNTTLATFTIPTDTQGVGTYDFCANSIFPTPGTYKFYARAYSHLRKRFTGVSAFNTYHDLINLTGTTNYLIAGETSNIFDNKINSLDLSYQINNQGTADYKADLNQDGVVDTLDFNITKGNFFKVGDPIP